MRIRVFSMTGSVRLIKHQLYVLSVIINKFVSKGKLSFDFSSSYNQQVMNKFHMTILKTMCNITFLLPTFCLATVEVRQTHCLKDFRIRYLHPRAHFFTMLLQSRIQNSRYVYDFQRENFISKYILIKLAYYTYLSL